MEWAGWAVAAVLGVVAFVRSGARRQAGAAALDKYPLKDRSGMAFVLKVGEDYKVAGGPKSFVARGTEKVVWSVFNASGRDVVVEFEFKPSTVPGAPPSPFREGNGPHRMPVSADPRKIEKLALKVLDKGAFPDRECPYEYSVRLQGIAGSEMDPQLDIWP